MNDIENGADIELLVDRFYEKVVEDPLIGFIFTEIVALSWDIHIPVMYAFWKNVLQGESVYNGNPMQKHIELDRLIPLRQDHFDRWLKLWEETISENFRGPLADQAKQRAGSIAALMLHKVTKSRSV